MAWELYGAVGTIVVKGVQRHGIAWMRDKDRRQVAFHALPLRSSFNPDDPMPPMAEQHVIPEDDFKPM